MGNLTDILRIVYGLVFVLFLPGYLFSYILFKRNKIDFIERLALSFALSIAVVPLFVFYTNLLGIPINFMSVTLQILFLISITLTVLLIKFILKKHVKS